MPEGDILRRTAVTLNRALRGAVLLGAELRWPDAGSVDLTGRAVLGTESYGKHLFTRFDDGRTLHTHLRMEGAWRVARTRTEELMPPHPDIRAVLAAAQWTATGHRLGMLDVVPTREERNLIAHLGPDVLADDFPVLGLPRALDRFAAQRDAPVADVLLDQRVVAGIGTIFMAESLFTRRLWPWTPADQLSDPASLLMTARRLMERSVAARMPTATGEVGRNRTTRVHGRPRQPCARCGTPIAVGHARRPPEERPVFYCPTCQVVGRPVSRRA